MTKSETEQLLTGVATIGAAILAGTSPATAGTFALGAIIREVPHLFAVASIVLAKGELTAEQKAQAHAEALALSEGLNAIPAATG